MAVTSRSWSAQFVAAVIFAGFASFGNAAVFDMQNGAVVEGDVAVFGEDYFAVSTGLGFQLMAKADVRAVNLPVTGGRVLTGRLSDWRQGVYYISEPDGRLWISTEGGYPSKMEADTATAKHAARRSGLTIADVASSNSQTSTFGDGGAFSKTQEPSIQPQPTEDASASGGDWAPITPPMTPSLPAAAAPSGSLSIDAPSFISGMSDILNGSNAERAELSEAIMGGEDLAAVVTPNQEAASTIEPASLRGRSTPRSTSEPRAAEIEGLSFAYRDAVSASSASSASDLQHCMRLAGLKAPMSRPAPVAFGGAEIDASRLVIGVDDGLGVFAAEAITHAFFDSAQIAPELDVSASKTAEGALTPLWVARQTTSVSRPKEIEVTSGARGDLAFALREGGLDIRVMADEPRGGVLIGFEPVVVAAPRSTGLRSLSLDQLRAVASGKVTTLSQIGAQTDAAPVFYLPPSGSEVTSYFALSLGLKSLEGASVRHIAGESERRAAAAQDPGAILITTRNAALNGMRALRIGDGETAAGSSMSAMRSGSYPLVRPLYLAISAHKGAHPLTSALGRFAVSDPATKALRLVGVLPVVDCAESSCRLSAPGLASALALREGLAAEPVYGALRGDVIAAGSTADLADLLSRVREGRLEASGMRVIAERGDGAGFRADALMLAARCAGASIRRFEANAAAAPAWRIELTRE